MVAQLWDQDSPSRNKEKRSHRKDRRCLEGTWEYLGMSWNFSAHLVAQGGFLDLLGCWPWLDWALLESQCSPGEKELKRSY